MPNVLGTMMHHPALAGPFLAYNNVLLFDARARARVSASSMVLRVAWRTRSRYEWAQHVRLATASRHHAGGDRRDRGGGAAATRRGRRSKPTCSPRPTSSSTRYRIDDDTWARLAEQLDERQLVELVFVVGTYTGLAMAFNSFGVAARPRPAGVRDPLTARFEE